VIYLPRAKILQGSEVILNDEPDDQVVQRMQRGDRDAVEVFYRRYLGSIWRFVLSKLRNEADARDVTSETFLAAIGGISSADPEAPALRWLLGIAKHKLADHFRRRNLRLEAVGDIPSKSASAMELAAQNERRERTLSTLHRIDDEDRAFLEWKYIEGLSIKEIASRMARTEKSIESALFRARNAFQEALNGARKRVEP
jgi:RNA polymerase sigma-70 factor (ECF subfamily)